MLLGSGVSPHLLSWGNFRSPKNCGSSEQRECHCSLHLFYIYWGSYSTYIEEENSFFLLASQSAKLSSSPCPIWPSSQESSTWAGPDLLISGCEDRRRSLKESQLVVERYLVLTLYLFWSCLNKLQVKGWWKSSVIFLLKRGKIKKEKKAGGMRTITPARFWGFCGWGKVSWVEDEDRAVQKTLFCS